MLRTILIVDDEQSIRKLIRAVLNRSVDAVFLEASDGTDALKTAREHGGNIDLLVSDVVMPGKINGFEMAAQLNHERPEMKIVLMSGYSGEEVAMEPNWHFIKKPFAVSEIREKIGSILTDNSFVA